jgi:hypothetical protein
MRRATAIPITRLKQNALTPLETLGVARIFRADAPISFSANRDIGRL